MLYAAWITAGATIALAVIAFLQLRALRLEQRKWQTLQACERFELDPLLNRQTELIFKASDSGKHYSPDRFVGPELQHAVINLLNYFDGIAIGIEQNLYHERIVRDHLESSLTKAVDTFLTNGLAGPAVEANHFQVLIRVRESWRTPPKPV